MSEVPQERLHKYLANAGVASRRACEELIAQERVTVDGELVSQAGTKVTPGVSEVCLDGEVVRPPRFESYLLYKPSGVVTSTQAQRGERTVMDYFPDQKTRLYPVGRLDKDSEGLVLLTNDGALAQYLTHPSNRVEKHYEVVTREPVYRETLDQLRAGIWLSEGKATMAKVEVVRLRGARPNCGLHVVLTQGRNRQIRRMLAKVSVKVRSLKRVAVGSLALEKLPPGGWRKLAGQEVRDLMSSGGSGKKHA